MLNVTNYNINNSSIQEHIKRFRYFRLNPPFLYIFSCHFIIREYIYVLELGRLNSFSVSSRSCLLINGISTIPIMIFQLSYESFFFLLIFGPFFLLLLLTAIQVVNNGPTIVLLVRTTHLGGGPMLLLSPEV
jgi:hypothetical protein